METDKNTWLSPNLTKELHDIKTTSFLHICCCRMNLCISTGEFVEIMKSFAFSFSFWNPVSNLILSVLPPWWPFWWRSPSSWWDDMQIKKPPHEGKRRRRPNQTVLKRLKLKMQLLLTTHVRVYHGCLAYPAFVWRVGCTRPQKLAFRVHTLQYVGDPVLPGVR